MGLFDPNWVKQLPPQVRPEGVTIKALERIRKEENIPVDTFACLVLQSPGTVRMIFEQQVSEFRGDQPNATKKEIFESILQRRTLSHVAAKTDPDTARQRLQNAKVQSKIRQVAEEAETIDDLVTYVNEEEQFWQSTRDLFGTTVRIAETLGYYRKK